VIEPKPASSEAPRVGGEQAAGAAILRWALVAVALSVAIRLLWASLAHVVPASDFEQYDNMAWRWLTTGTFRGAYRTPGYPGFLAAIYWLFGHSVRAAQVMQALLGALTSGLVVLLAGRFVAPRTAGIAGLLHALWPTSIAYVAVLASENVAAPLFVGLLLALATEAASLRRRMCMTGLAGLLLALLVLVRPACLGLLPAAALLAVWEPRSGRWRAAPGLVFAAAMLVAMSPWSIRNHQLGLSFTTIATTGGENLWMGNNDSARNGGFEKGELEPLKRPGSLSRQKRRDETLRAEALRWIADHPARYLGLCATRTARMWGTTADGYAARVLWPTAENSEIVVAAGDRDEASDDLREGERVLVARHRAILRWLRVFAAPLILIGYALCLRSFRRYAAMTLPVLCYAGFLSATYFLERLRELSDPALLVALAALGSDVILGTAELPGRRRAKVLVAAGAVLISVVVRLTALDAGWYRL
jgi:4-amino-4-deoxy-L-arabinose transferase-like glycosyltransferase